MDPILQVLLSWQFVFFGLAIAAIMYVLRLMVEYLATVVKKDLSNSKLWNDLILPVLPVIMGALGAYFFRLFPYPGFADGPRGYVIAGDRIIFGLVAGLLSTLMYRVIKSLLYQKMVNAAQYLNGTSIQYTQYTQQYSPNQQYYPNQQYVPLVPEPLMAGATPPRGTL